MADDGPSGSPTVTEPAQRIQVALAEYGSLRQESLQAITNRLQVLSFTFAALSVIIAATLTGKIPALAAALVTIIVVPSLAKAALLVWLGEYSRSQRAGRWIAELELRINNDVGGKPVLGWESKLLTRSAHMGFPYLAVVALLLGLGYAGYGLGTYFFTRYLGYHKVHPSWYVWAGGAALIVIAEGCFLWWLRGAWLVARLGPQPTDPE
jgi:tellurite resistance protein TehA-like permease